MKIIREYLSGFIALLYPRQCPVCNKILQGNDSVICAACMNSLPETGYHRSDHNPVNELFYGRVRIRSAFSLLFFEKGSKYRRLIYHLKYKGYKEAGIFLGKLIGSRILESSSDRIDMIIPIPLHPSKYRRRGFNQSSIIAEGIAAVLKIPVYDKGLKRRVGTATQTRKGRYDRWKNVDGIFICPDPEKLKGKHILLVDDVVTTGATLEVASGLLLGLEGTSVSIATAAYALP